MEPKPIPQKDGLEFPCHVQGKQPESAAWVWTAGGRHAGQRHWRRLPRGSSQLDKSVGLRVSFLLPIGTREHMEANQFRARRSNSGLKFAGFQNVGHLGRCSWFVPNIVKPEQHVVSLWLHSATPKIPLQTWPVIVFSCHGGCGWRA